MQIPRQGTPHSTDKSEVSLRYEAEEGDDRGEKNLPASLEYEKVLKRMEPDKLLLAAHPESIQHVHGLVQDSSLFPLLRSFLGT